MNDRLAMLALGACLFHGTHGVTKDEMAGHYHLVRAAELGSAEACTIIAIRYGIGGDSGFPPRNKQRENLFIRIATARGDIQARYSLGLHEYNDLGNHEVGVQHFKIAAEAGHKNAFDALKRLVDTDRHVPGKEFITKDELDKIRHVAGFDDEEEEEV